MEASKIMSEEIRLNADGDVVAAWKTGLALGRSLGFGPFKQACLSSAVLEMSRHVVESGGGTCVLADASDGRSRRAAIWLHGVGADLVDRAHQRLNTETSIGAAMPSVKLRSVVETCGVEPQADGATISLTIQEPRVAAPRFGGRPARNIGTFARTP